MSNVLSAYEVSRRERVIRKMRRQGKTILEMAAALGLKRWAVTDFCRRQGIPLPRAGKAKNVAHSWYSVPPIDPEKAARITREKMRFWGMEKSA